MAFKDFFFGKEEQMKQLPTINPQQLQLLQQLLGSLGGQGGQQGLLGQGLEQMGSQLQGYAPGKSPMEQMAMRQFREQQVPELSEMFAGMNAGSSGGFGQQLGAAASGLSERMAGMRQNQQQQGFQNLMGLGGMGLGAQPFAYQHQQGTPGFLGGLSQGLGQAAGMLPFLL